VRQTGRTVPGPPRARPFSWRESNKQRGGCGTGRLPRWLRCPKEDDDLVIRAKTDRAAFSLLYDRYYPRVARYCLNPGEQDLINAFKLCSEISKGEFPDTPSQAGRIFFFAKHTRDRWKNPSDDEMKQLVNKMGSISRGFDFAWALPESADAHYAGKGVKQGTVDRAIFWYRSEGSKRCRVIYADFSIKDADQPPQVSGAERLRQTSKASKPTEK
jgi:hypothetical protein